MIITDLVNGDDRIYVQSGQNWLATGIQSGDKVVVTVGNERIICTLDNDLISMLFYSNQFFSLDLTQSYFTFVKANDNTTPSTFANFENAVHVGASALIQLEDSQGNRTAGITINVINDDDLPN